MPPGFPSDIVFTSYLFFNFFDTLSPYSCFFMYSISFIYFYNFYCHFICVIVAANRCQSYHVVTDSYKRLHTFLSYIIDSCIIDIYIFTCLFYLPLHSDGVNCCYSRITVCQMRFYLSQPY